MCTGTTLNARFGDLAVSLTSEADKHRRKADATREAAIRSAAVLVGPGSEEPRARLLADAERLAAQDEDIAAALDRMAESAAVGRWLADPVATLHKADYLAQFAALQSDAHRAGRHIDGWPEPADDPVVPNTRAGRP